MRLMDAFHKERAGDSDLDAMYQRELREYRAGLRETEEGLRPCDCPGHSSAFLEVAGAVLMLLCLPIMLPFLWWDGRRQARALRGTGRDL